MMILIITGMDGRDEDETMRKDRKEDRAETWEEEGGRKKKEREKTGWNTRA
jgi:hypothetical protein